MKLSKRKILAIASMLVTFALYVVAGLAIKGSASYYVFGVVILASIYSVFAQFKKAKEIKDLKRMRDEVLEARWQEDMKNRPNL